MNCNCNGNIDITGCRVSIYPMSDKYVDILTETINNTDLSGVWNNTDLFSTIVRGNQTNVIDASKALFVNSYHNNIHSVCELTYSKGCPGDSAADNFITTEIIKPNDLKMNDDTFKVYVKFSFYAFNEPKYMQHIANIVEMANDNNVTISSAHYTSILEGSAKDVFTYFNNVLSYAHENINHYVLEATISVNSPSLKEGQNNE